VRWLLIQPGPSWSVADVFNGWSEALTALGETVEEYELDVRLRWFSSQLVETGEVNDQGQPGIRKSLSQDQAIVMATDGILAACHRFWPHIVLCTSAFFVPPWMLEVIRGRGHKIVMLMTESPYQDDFQLKMAEYADLTLINDPVNLAAYRKIGPAEWMPHAYRPKVHYPPAPGTEPVWDLAFIGTGFPSRIKFFSQMNLDGLKVHFDGLWMDLADDSPLRDWTDLDPEGCIDNDEAAAIYRQSRCGINFYRREAEDTHEGEGWACGPREIEQAACGLFYLRDPRGEGDSLFHMLPTFDSPGDAAEKLRWWVAHDGFRHEAARKARAAIEGRTFEANARRLLALLDQ
jgi:spore maturation protein CgeB